MGLDLKGRRGPLLVLIALGLAIVAAIVGIVVLTAGGDGNAGASSKLDTSFTQPADFESVDAVYADADFTCQPTDSMCVRDFLVKVTADYGPQAALGVIRT